MGLGSITKKQKKTFENDICSDMMMIASMIYAMTTLNSTYHTYGFARQVIVAFDERRMEGFEGEGGGGGGGL